MFAGSQGLVFSHVLGARCFIDDGAKHRDGITSKVSTPNIGNYTLALL